jgi:hypothetical protein
MPTPVPDEALAAVLLRLDAGELGDPLPVVAYLAGRRAELPAADVADALRRAMLLLAAGGDPRRGLEVDGRAVKALALDLHSDERRAALAAALDELVVLARELPHVRKAALFLAAEVDLAWRLYALGLLAEELDEPDREVT